MSARLLKIVFFVGIFTTLGFSLGCEDPDLADLAKGQECMDKARTSADAAKCRKYVKGNSQNAKVLNCSVEMMAAGLDSAKIRSAFTALETAANNVKEQLMMQALIMDPDISGSVDAGEKADAEAARNACVAADVSGLMYIANLAFMGTSIAQLSGTGGVNLQASIDQCVINGIATCNSSGELDDSAEIIAEAYCVGDNEDTVICSAIDQAIINAAAGPNSVGEELLLLMDAN